MSLAFAILAHRNASQLARLVRVLDRPGDLILLHVDRRADASLHRAARELARTRANVLPLRSRTILWGGYGMVAAQIEAIAVALRSGHDWHHFINLTGQDFPIKPLDGIEVALRTRGDASYVSWFDPLRTSLWKDAPERLHGYCLEWPWLDRVLRLRGFGWRLRRFCGWEGGLPRIPGLRRKPPPFRWFGGANHVILSRAACRHVATDPSARWIRRWLRHSAHANETLFPTVLLNSPLAATIVNTHLREIDFLPHALHPRTFTSRDFDRLTASPMFFARKFDETVDAGILDRLEVWLRASASYPAATAHR